MSGWKTLSTRIAYESPFMRVHEDQAVNPAGKTTIYGYCESTETAAYIVAVDDDKRVYLVEQYRYPLKRLSWEVIAGRIANTEDIATGAQRELFEEAGIEAGELTRLGELHAAPGITTFSWTVFLARQLHKLGKGLDKADGITNIRKFSFADVDRMIQTGRIKCSSSIASYYLAKTYLEATHV
jgi:8-oxo-dGTP pyrophosphatase MutT (NUDIX family)